MQDKIKQELSGQPSTRMFGMFSTFHLLALKGRWGACFVLSAALLLTFTAWYSVRGEVFKRAQTRFNFRIKTIEAQISERLQAYEFLLQGGSGLFSASNEVTRKEWRAYVNRLHINQYYPGLQGIGFSKRILPSEKEAHIRQIRGEGFPRYTIYPDGERPEYTSIIFLEPFDWRNQRAFGYDMFSQTTRRNAMIRARDTGKPALSGKVTLVQETDKDIQSGFLIYQAIYRKGEPQETPEQRRKALLGYVHSPFRINAFMKGVLAEKRDYVDLQIFDGDKPLKETLLYQSNSEEEPHNHPEGHHFAAKQIILESASHSWLLSFVPSKHFEENISYSGSNFILVLGLIISLLLFSIVLSLFKSHSQAISLANTTVDLKKANIGLKKEIKERKQTEAMLKNSEHLFNEIGHIARIGGWEHDLITGEISWTHETYNIFELESGPIQRLEKYLSFYIPKDRKILEEAYRLSVEIGKQFDLELQADTAKGRSIWVRVVGQPDYQDGACIKMKGILQNITEQKKVEMQLQQAQKMESIGQLAGGIAHDYNNISTIIISYCEFALKNTKQGDPVHEDLLTILNAAKRSTAITRQLLAFARKQDITPKVLDLNDIVGNMLKMVQRLIGEDIDVDWVPGAEIWLVNVDPSQVDQIIVNLAVNARDAITNVGKITIETRNISFDEDYCADHVGFIPGDFLLLVVSDDGNGIEPDIQHKIFEPFFTTKSLGKGTGLGLSTVYGIVKQNNGFINVYSEPKKGTTFNIYLPRHEGQNVEAHRDNNIEIPLPLSRGETILLVEDDGAVLKLGKRILEELGYIVLSTLSPQEAIKLAEEQTGKIHLLITDVIMPEMNGRYLSENLQSHYPNLKSLFMSGYTADFIASRGVLDDDVFFISKPFSKKDMAVKVREVLAKD